MIIISFLKTYLNQKILEAINLESGEYLATKKIDLGIDTVNLNKLIDRDDKYGQYAWSIISKIINILHLWFLELLINLMILMKR